MRYLSHSCLDEIGIFDEDTLIHIENHTGLMCDVTPSAPTLHQLLRTISIFLAGDQQVVPIGASHISLPLQEIQSREWEKKEQTNNMLGLTQVQKGSYVTLCICRLTLAWISCENSTTLLECQPILTGLHSLVWTLSRAVSSLCCSVSTGHSCHPSPTAFFQSLCPTLFSCSRTHFRSREISSPNPLSGFAPKQTKGSSAWRTTNIVLQMFVKKFKK